MKENQCKKLIFHGSIAVLYIIFVMLITINLSFSQRTQIIGIIPHPYSISYFPANDHFVLSPSTTICYNSIKPQLQFQAQLLSDYINQQTLMPVKYSGVISDKCSIILDIGYPDANEEAYKPTITSDSISINGSTEKGSFYGIQSLRKMIPVQKTPKKIKILTQEIIDRPRFSYRGLLLDVARYFRTVEEVKKFMDIMALHNMNFLHFHLTDDQGWRIEIPKYPDLTRIGSRRRQTKGDGIPISGFFTRKDILDLIEYGQSRQITIIPEIDLPGHAQSALTAYPKLGCTGGPYEVSERFEVHSDMLCYGNPESMVFIKDVLSYVMDLFPSKYVHIGGDEAEKSQWKACQKCQAKIRELGFVDDQISTKEDKLQRHLTIELSKIISSKGKEMIGWSEIAHGEKVENSIVMSWLRNKNNEMPEKDNYTVIPHANKSDVSRLPARKKIQLEYT